jgi:hypothetical protein
MAAVAGTLLENVPAILALTPAPLPGTTKIVPVPAGKLNVLLIKLQLNALTFTLLISKSSDRFG